MKREGRQPQEVRVAVSPYRRFALQGKLFECDLLFRIRSAPMCHHILVVLHCLFLVPFLYYLFSAVLHADSLKGCKLLFENSDLRFEIVGSGVSSAGHLGCDVVVEFLHNNMGVEHVNHSLNLHLGSSTGNHVTSPRRVNFKGPCFYYVSEFDERYRCACYYRY